MSASKIWINAKLLTSTAHIPEYSTEFSAGADLCADINEPILILPHRTVKIPTGVAMAIPEGYFGAIYARSGLATKHGLRPANAVGIIDADFRGGLIVALHNDTDDAEVIEPGQKIAQIVFQKFKEAYFNEVDDLDETKRGSGGFGSTGKF